MSRPLRRALAVVLLGALPARADLFSPGELAKAHAPFEGLSNCVKCHPAGGQLSQDTCLDCHDELTGRVAKGLGFHGRIPQDKRACEGCHHEHQGRDFELVDWGAAGKKAFDHKRAGWALEGGHQKVACADCHAKRFVTQPRLLKLFDARPHTSLGLVTTCSVCHFDEHRGQTQGKLCTDCHTDKAWKPAPSFDHAKTEYPLTGLHAKVACDKCHPTVPDDEKRSGGLTPKKDTFLKFAPVAHETCLDCHKDPHDNRFGPRCTSCHTTASWHVIRNASAERAFHDKTRFKLEGAHADVDCRDCHGPRPGLPTRFKGLKFEACTDCHFDAHLGQLTEAGKPLPCQRCHGVDAFTPASYGPTEHEKARYPLQGAHRVVACEACHATSAPLKAQVNAARLADLKRRHRLPLFSFTALHFSRAPGRCDDCHQDVHQGQLTPRRACDACHRVDDFHQLTFDHDKDARFPLAGKHAKVPCAKCHAAPKPGAPISYRPLEQRCAACHEDVHVGQLATDGQTKCERCHDTQDFTKTAFRHEPPFTTYRLEGAHGTARCEGCHPRVAVKGAKPTARYRPTARACEACHADFHQGAFRGFEP